VKPSAVMAARRAGVWRWIAERSAEPNGMLVLAAVLFAAIFALRVGDSRPADATLVLCVVPIVICAIARGPLGGAAASVVGIALTAAWELHGEADVGPVGYAARAVAFVVVGLIVGRYAAQRRALERRLARSYDVAVDLQCTAGFDGYFKRVNPAWRVLLGHTEHELLARPFLELVHPADRDRTRREAERLASGDARTVDFENRFRTREGSYRWLAWTARSVPADGVIYASARDITEQKGQRELLERLVAERTRDLQAARLEALRRLALAAEYRDDDTHQHTERVGALAALLANRLGLPDEFTEQLRQAAPLHDVGKLGVLDAILLKPGRLSSDERSQMQTHTTIGAAILAGSGFPLLSLGEQIALSHHERWDGTGYPHRAKGEAIPLAGRIVAVADVFDALTHVRPYKPAWPLEEAVAEIVGASGTQFDPRVVAAFADLHRAGSLDPFVADTPAIQPAPATRHRVAV
jgi:PAS domain S-box-containing protein